MENWKTIVEDIRWDFETWEDHVKVTDNVDSMLWQLYQDGLSPAVLTQLEVQLTVAFKAAVTNTAEEEYYVDNVRVCIGPRQTKRYYKIRLAGCCGEYDEFIQTGSCSVWFGFNYGH